MSFLCMHVSPLARHDPSDLVSYSELSVEAPEAAVATEGSLGDPSHHAQLDGSSAIVWLAHELTQCDDVDWLNSDDDAHEWCVVPVPTTQAFAFPQSPTSVDCSSNMPSDNSVDMSDAEYCSPRSVQYDRRGCKAEKENSMDGLAGKLDKMAIAAATRDPRLNVKHEEDIKVQLAHAKWVGGDVRQEIRRRRQRGYEQKYRKKRLSTYKGMLSVWARKEIELYTMMQERIKPCVVDFPTPTYEQLLQEERAARLDQVHLKSLAKWCMIFQIRIDSEIKAQLTQDAWAAHEWSLLGAGVTKPFRPFRYTFEW